MTLASARLTAATLAALTMIALPCAVTAKAKPQPAPTVIVDTGEIQSAMDEKRFQDAGRMIDRASIGGSRDPMVSVLAGELSLARGRYDDALKIFKQIPDG